MNKTITLKTSESQILKLFRECKGTGSVNLTTKKGFIYLAGGILCKLENDKHFYAHKGKWVLLDY